MTLIDTTMQFTREDKLKALERELKFRREVYARRVGEGRMSQKTMDYQIAVFEAIAADYAEPRLTARQASTIRKALARLDQDESIDGNELSEIAEVLRDMQR